MTSLEIISITKLDPEEKNPPELHNELCLQYTDRFHHILQWKFKYLVGGFKRRHLNEIYYENKIDWFKKYTEGMARNNFFISLLHVLLLSIIKTEINVAKFK